MRNDPRRSTCDVRTRATRFRDRLVRAITVGVVALTALFVASMLARAHVVPAPDVVSDASPVSIALVAGALVCVWLVLAVVRTVRG